MKVKDILTPSFTTLQQQQHHHPTERVWQRCLSIRNQFCEAVVRAGFLSWEQMVNAACRYCIGASKLGGVIFWQIDHEGRVHDGKVMYYLLDCHRNKAKEAHPVWVSTLLARRETALALTMNHSHFSANQTSHCFFGLHLLDHTDLTDYTDNISAVSAISARPKESVRSVCDKTICIVEAEKSAFILSELFPDCIWLAAGGLGEVQSDKFRPLRGRKVVLFPDTDSDGIAFRRWSEAANQVMQSPFWENSPPIRVSPILELHASTDQKRRKIDLVDFLFEGHTDATDSTDINPSNPRNPCSCQIQGEFSL